ncbi:MAG: hypothetical protein V1822_01060 [Candidatus Micrarchaeota archaeon]
MRKIDCTRAITDLSAAGSTLRLMSMVDGIKPPSELMVEYAVASKRIECPWSFEKTAQPERASSLQHKEKYRTAWNSFIDIARIHGISKVGLSDKPYLELRGTELILPKEAYTALILWHRFSSDNKFNSRWEKSAAGPNSYKNFEPCLDAFFDFLMNSEDSAWSRKAGEDKRAMAAFAFGCLAGGMDFICQIPTLLQKRLRGPLAQFRPYATQIEFFAAQVQLDMNYFALLVADTPEV